MSEKDVNLLEAKGRYESISFSGKPFDEFRLQVNRARLIGASGKEVSVKGFISVGRWAIERKPRVKARLSVEDPWTEGSRTDDGASQGIGASMVAGHYRAVLRALQLPLLADRLGDAVPLRRELEIGRYVWECIGGPLKGRRFVGGLLPPRYSEEPILWSSFDGYGRDFYLLPPLKFFGLEEGIFDRILTVVESGAIDRTGIEAAVIPDNLDEISFHRDGSVLAPAEYFKPIGRKSF